MKYFFAGTRWYEDTFGNVGVPRKILKSIKSQSTTTQETSGVSRAASEL